MMHFLTIGGILGMGAGLSPGPLLTLVIAETLRHGVKGGVKVAMAPVVTDLPIILGAFFLLRQWSDFKGFLGIMSLLGGLFVLYLAVDGFRAPTVAPPAGAGPSRSLLKGVLANALNPHPYLFWITVGAPLMIKALNLGVPTLTAFLGAFYTCLLGAKILLAFLVGSSRRFLVGRVYLYTLRCLGLLLGGLAFFLFRDGLKLLGWI